jgi:hypothetical protein
MTRLASGHCLDRISKVVQPTNSGSQLDPKTRSRHSENQRMKLPLPLFSRSSFVNKHFNMQIAAFT